MFLSSPTRNAAAAILVAAFLLPVNDSEDEPPVGSEGGPTRALSSDEAKIWLGGRDLFEHTWVEAYGLGARGFNAESCGHCHNAPTVGGAGSNAFNVIRMSKASGYEPGRMPGNQLTRLREMRERFEKDARENLANADGTFDLRDFTGALFQEIQTPSLFGVGRIDTISEAEILLREDPDDIDGDGIRGVARRVTVENGKPSEEIGRFGWKSQAPRLADFVCLALGGEIGLTVPDQGRGFGLTDDPDHVWDPEVTQPMLDGLIFFVASLAPPKRAGRADENGVRLGEDFFLSMGCAACHVPALPGTDGPVKLYSDLLLHEVLPKPPKIIVRGLEADSPVDEPEPAGFRTPPLWGIGKTAPYMHDGRADTLREAILAHHGEAARARGQFELLDEPDQCAVIMFLEDL